MLKIKDCFMLNTIADESIVVPVGNDAIDFSAVLVLNDTLAFLWPFLYEGCTKEQLVDSLIRKYSVTHEVAVRDINTLLDKLAANKMLEDDYE